MFKTGSIYKSKSNGLLWEIIFIDNKRQYVYCKEVREYTSIACWSYRQFKQFMDKVK